MEGRTRTTDGRVARRQRNQDTVLDAVIGLFDAGRSEPAVDDVSELSGVSTRSIYRYFHHREGLIDAAVWHLMDRVEADLALHVGDGPLDARIARFVDHRLAVFARIAPIVRASKRLARPLPADQLYGAERANRSNDGEPIDGQSNDGEPNGGQSNGGQSNGGQSNGGQSNGGQSNDGQTNGDGRDEQRVGVDDGQRSLFAVAPSVAFASDFGRVDPASRKIAEVSADAMLQFDTLDGLARTLACDRTMMAMVLERHLRQQIAPV